MLVGAGRKTRVHQVRGCSPLFLCNEAEIVSELSAKLSKKLSEFIAEHTSELVEPECVKIYYDNGQTEVTRILVSVFNALLPRIEI